MLATVGGNPCDITLFKHPAIQQPVLVLQHHHDFSFGEIEKETQTNYKKKLQNFFPITKSNLQWKILYKDNRKSISFSSLVYICRTESDII